MSKLSYNEIQADLTLFTNAARAVYESDSFAAGYLQSQLASMIMELPKRKQDALLASFRKSTAELELKR